MYKHLFFDLDNTLTRSRSLVTPEMKHALQVLVGKGHDIVVVSGASVERAQEQMDKMTFYYLGQSGNHAIDGKTGKELWRRELSPSQKKEIYDHIRSIPRTWNVKDENDLVEDRGSQISYSLLGHHEVREKKEVFDPDFEGRRQLLEEHPLVSDSVEVKMGGTTCFDYVQKGKHKGYNIAEFIKLMDWRSAECIYVGDALFPGGNDSSVIGMIDTQPTKNPEETLAFVQGLVEQKE